MNKRQIEKAAGEYSGRVLGFKDNPMVMNKHKAFMDGAQWMVDRLCNLPLDILVAELAEYRYIKEETE